MVKHYGVLHSQMRFQGSLQPEVVYDGGKDDWEAIVVRRGSGNGIT
jgi:hypothetical protein